MASWFSYPAVVDGPVLCPSKLALGTPCPGCGMTRSFGALAHGDVRSAFAWHPGAPVVAALFVVLYVFAVTRAAQGRPVVPAPAWVRHSVSGVAILLTVVFVVRMFVFFSTADGWRSLATQNMIARLIRRDLGNTHEVFPVDTPRRAP